MPANLPLKDLFIIISFLLVSSLSPTSAIAATDKDKPVIIVLGDSISAGYGINLKYGWVNLLQEKLNQTKHRYQVINASVSGDTSGGGLARLPFTLKQHQPSIVILELGGNDGLRGLPISSIYNNFSNMIKLCRQNDSKVLLLGMQIPPNYGQKYTQAFRNIYQELTEKQQVPLLPFLFKGIVENPQMIQADGIHPTQKAQIILLNNVWEALLPLL